MDHLNALLIYFYTLETVGSIEMFYYNFSLYLYLSSIDSWYLSLWMFLNY